MGQQPENSTLPVLETHLGWAMSFATLTFVLFCPLVFVLYWTLEHYRRQNLCLIAASYLFYGWWDWRFCGLMLASSLIDFTIGLRLGQTESQRGRRFLLGASLFCNLTLLGIFKYYGFFLDNLRVLLSEVGWELHLTTYQIILPVGISFYTFQTLSYTIDIYRRKQEPTRNLIDYLAFVSFFPQLVAGPIERASHLLPQFAGPRTFDMRTACDGCRWILWGLAKKLILADRLAIVVDQIYSQADGSGGPLLVFGTVCFAFQIYCDFSAYSEIAKGTAQLFGINLMRNFAYPYFSQSLAEFWRRWHISLSTWFRDYVYIPLGGSQGSPLRTRFNLLVTFLISGFWHGAAWRYLAWGAINGLFVFGKRRDPQRNPTPDQSAAVSFFPSAKELARMLGTFGIICLGWVFFRAASMTEGISILRRIFADLFAPTAYTELFDRIHGTKIYRESPVLLCLFIVVEWVQREKPCPLTFSPRSSTGLRWAVYTVLIWGTLYLMPPQGSQQFIYFEF